jgi:hypothetical protein
MASIDNIISNAQSLAGSAQSAAIALYNSAYLTAQSSIPQTSDKTLDEVAVIDALTYANPDDFAVTLDAPDAGAMNLENSFNAAVVSQRTDMQTFIAGGVQGWLTAFIPDYADSRDELTAKITAGMEGGIAISDASEQAIYTRSRDRIDAENAAAQSELAATMARRGFPLPTGILSASLRQTQKDAADRSARAALETVVQRLQFETQFAQACLGASQALFGSSQQSMIAYAGIVATLNEATVTYANAVVAAIDATVKTQLAVAVAKFEAGDTTYKNTLAALTLNVEHLAKKLTFQVQEAGLLLDQAKAQVQADLEVDRLRTQHELAKMQAIVSAANAGSSPQASIASSAISSINTTVSEHKDTT